MRKKYFIYRVELSHRSDAAIGESKFILDTQFDAYGYDTEEHVASILTSYGDSRSAYVIIPQYSWKY